MDMTGSLISLLMTEDAEVSNSIKSRCKIAGVNAKGNVVNIQRAPLTSNGGLRCTLLVLGLASAAACSGSGRVGTLRGGSMLALASEICTQSPAASSLSSWWTDEAIVADNSCGYDSEWSLESLESDAEVSEFPSATFTAPPLRVADFSMEVVTPDVVEVVTAPVTVVVPEEAVASAPTLLAEAAMAITARVRRRSPISRWPRAISRLSARIQEFLSRT